MNKPFVLTLLFYVFISLIPAFIADHKGRSFGGYYFLSLLVSPLIAIIVTLCVSNVNKSEANRTRPQYNTQSRNATLNQSGSSKALSSGSGSVRQITSDHFDPEIESIVVTPLRCYDQEYVVCPRCHRCQKAGRERCESCNVKFKENSVAPDQEPMTDTPQTTISPDKSEQMPVEGSTPKIRFCRKCGFQLLNDSDFCSHCGTKVVAVPREPLVLERSDDTKID